MTSHDDIERYVDDLLEVSGMCRGGAEPRVRVLLHRLFVAVALYDQLSADERQLVKEMQRKLKYFFCAKFDLKERKRNKEKEQISPTPPKKEKEEKEKGEKTRDIVCDAISAVSSSRFSERQMAFHEECIKYVGRVDNQLLTDFFNYWSEDSVKTGKMRFEYEKTWNTAKRIKRWMSSCYSAADTAAAIRLKKARKQAQQEVAATEQAQQAAALRRQQDEREAEKSRDARANHQLTEDYELSAGAGRHSRARRQTRPGVARREGGFVRPLSGKAEAAVPVFRSSSRRGDVRRGEKKKPGSSS